MHQKIKILTLLAVILTVAVVPIFSKAEIINKEKENFANVIFFAYFKGDTEGRDYLINNFTEFKKMYDAESELSVKGYLDKVSYSKFNLINIYPQYDGTALVPIELPCTSDGLESTNMDYTIIQSIINSVPGISDKLDYNNDGFIDNVSIILKGGSKDAESNSTLVSHKSDYAGSDKWSGLNLGTYNMLNTYTISASGAGVITHEFMHSLGYPDLYTYDNSYPVYTWDIMGAVSKQMSYPLAYLRMKFSNWLSIDTITTSQTLTLDTQDNENGNQAYILKSPLNEYELFVVEFRKKPEINDVQHLDRLIGNSGIIVYRINTMVEGLSNARGGIGVYVFRDEPDSETEAAIKSAVYNAALSKETGRTQIGSSDLSVTKSALTFSDGTNSGIVIKNVSSSSGKQMTLDVEVPAESQYDTWKNTNFVDDVGGNSYTTKSANILAFNNSIYAVTVGNNKIYTRKYEQNSWNTVGETSVSNTNNVLKANMLEMNNELYLIISEWEKIVLYKFQNSDWKQIATLSDTNGLNNYKVYNNELYISKVDYNGKNVGLFKLENGSFKNLGTYYSGSSFNEYAGSPNVEIINGTIYAINNQANGVIRLYKKDNSNYNEIQTNMNANQYAVISLNNKLYFALGSDSNNKKMRIIIYDGQNFETVNTDIELGAPQITVSQGNLYILATDTSASGKTVVYGYDENSKTLKQEGENVDNSADFNSLSLASLNNEIYVILKRGTDGKFIVKMKEAKVIEPVSKTLKQYLEEVGFKVFENYVSGFELNQTLSGIKQKLGNSEIKVENSKNAEIVGTGTTFSYNNEKYISVVYGDIDGDGRINSLDLLKMRQHLIKKSILTNENEKAGQIARSGKINSLDLLKLRRHLLKLEKIQQ